MRIERQTVLCLRNVFDEGYNAPDLRVTGAHCHVFDADGKEIRRAQAVDAAAGYIEVSSLDGCDCGFAERWQSYIDNPSPDVRQPAPHSETCKQTIGRKRIEGAFMVAAKLDDDEWLPVECSPRILEGAT